MPVKAKIWTAVAVSMVFVIAVWVFQLRMTVGERSFREDVAGLDEELQRASADWGDLWRQIQN